MGVNIGIDFGTTNTVVTYKDKKGNLKQIKHEGYEIIPSALFYQTRDKYFCGVKALAMYKRMPKAGIVSFKSKLGESGFSFNVEPVNDKKFKQVPKSATQYFLNRIFQSAEGQLLNEFGEEGTISRVVVTVPAKFNAVEREAIRQSVMKALGTGNKEDALMAFEPTAAAIAAMDERGEQGPDAVLVYDFGGGTFDISLIRRERRVFRQVITEGDKRLGGNDLTLTIMADMLDRINEYYGCEFPMDELEFDEEASGVSLDDYRRNMNAIHLAANTLKEDLSEFEEADFTCTLVLPDRPDTVYQIEVTREELEDLIAEQIERTVDLVGKVLNSPEARAVGGVDTLVLAGGSSQIPLIPKLLKKRFPDLKVIRSSNGSKIISRGAAILAQRIDELEYITEQNATTALGVAVTKGMHFNKFETLIPAGTPLPARGSKDFQLVRDGQEVLDIRYYEHDAKNYPEASTITDDGIEEVDRLLVSLPAGLSKDETTVRLDFLINKDGSIEIKADIRDLAGRSLGSGQTTVQKESELL